MKQKQSISCSVGINSLQACCKQTRQGYPVQLHVAIGVFATNATEGVMK